MTEPRTYPINTLAHLFPAGFAEFWQRMKMKENLEQIIYHYIPATLEKEEIKKTLASGGYGWGAIAITGHFTERYWFSRFEPWPDDFLAKFKTNLIYIISDIRRKESLWTQIYKDLDKLLKPLKLKTDTRTSQNYDKTLTSGGKTINTGNETHQQTEQRQTNQKNIPIYSNVDMASTAHGGFSRQQQLATSTTEQGQTQGSSNRKNTTDKINHKNTETYRSQKDANVSITNQDIYDWKSVGRMLNTFQITVIDFTQYYKLFDKLMVKLFGASVIEITDPHTGKRTWKPQGDYQHQETETSTGKPIIPEGNEWDETLPCLERLQIYHSKNEKEHSKLPDTSNRKPRIALRIKIGEGAVPAYQKPLNLPTSQLFKDRINGKIESFQKVIGYQNIIQTVVDYLENWEFAKEFGTQPPEQLMIGLLGEPGLGKTYISQAIGKALGVGFHMISLNGKKDASIVYGTNIENPGAEPGEIIKAIFRTQSQGCVILFDEIEKAGKDAKDNILLSLIPTLISDFLKPKRPLPTDPVNYDWKFLKKEDLDRGDQRRNRPPCPYATDQTQPHRANCKCFMANLAKVKGWKENMEDNKSNQGGTPPSASNPPPTAQNNPNPQTPPNQSPPPHKPPKSTAKENKWKNINHNFNDFLIQEWENQGFTYEQTREWIDIGLNVQDANFCAWIRDVVEATPIEILNNADLAELREQFNQYQANNP